MLWKDPARTLYEYSNIGHVVASRSRLSELAHSAYTCPPLVSSGGEGTPPPPAHSPLSCCPPRAPIFYPHTRPRAAHARPQVIMPEGVFARTVSASEQWKLRSVTDITDYLGVTAPGQMKITRRTVERYYDDGVSWEKTILDDMFITHLRLARAPIALPEGMPGTGRAPVALPPARPLALPRLGGRCRTRLPCREARSTHARFARRPCCLWALANCRECGVSLLMHAVGNAVSLTLHASPAWRAPAVRQLVRAFPPRQRSRFWLDGAAAPLRQGVA